MTKTSKFGALQQRTLHALLEYVFNKEGPKSTSIVLIIALCTLASVNLKAPQPKEKPKEKPKETGQPIAS